MVQNWILLQKISISIYQKYRNLQVVDMQPKIQLCILCSLLVLYIFWTFVNDSISFHQKKNIVTQIVYTDCVKTEDKSRQFHALETLQMFLLSFTSIIFLFTLTSYLYAGKKFLSFLHAIFSFDLK